MHIKKYIAAHSNLAFAMGNFDAHHWFIDVSGEEYLELIKRLKDIKWNKQVRWYPNYYPGDKITNTALEAHIIALDDRDATLIKMSL